MNPKDLIAPEGYTAQWDASITDEEYHKIWKFTGSGTLRRMLQSPKNFYYRVFKQQEEEEREVFRVGQLVHMAVLEGSRFKDRYVIQPDFGDMRSSKNRDLRDAWRNELPAGKILTTSDELEMIVGIIDSIFEHPNGPDLLKNGKAEMPGFYRDPETGIGLKIKPDFLSLDCKRLVDLKTTVNSTPKKFGSSTFEYRYDLQIYMQAMGVKEITGKWPDVISIIAVEKKPPYECAIYYFTPELLFEAEKSYRQILNHLKICIDTDIWPQRQMSLEPIFLPRWFVNQSTED